MLRSLSYTSGEQGRAYAQASAEALTLARYPWACGTVVAPVKEIQAGSQLQWPESGQPCQLLITV